MKRKLISLILCLILCCSLIPTVSAASGYVLDYGGLMSNSETADLEQRAVQLKTSYGIDVVILTTPELYGRSPESVADDFYDNNGYSEDGVLFLVDMGSRQWHISTAGACIEMLSDRDLIAIEDAVISYFSEGRFYGGFARFLDMLPSRLAVESESGFSLLLSLIIGAAIAGIAIAVMRSSMNTKHAQRGAASYQTEGSYRQTIHQDLFLYSNISKRPRPQNNPGTRSPGGHSSIHRSSSGRSHGGRGGRF